MAHASEPIAVFRDEECWNCGWPIRISALLKPKYEVTSDWKVRWIIDVAEIHWQDSLCGPCMDEFGVP